MARTAHIVRETSESHIDLELNLDGTGKTDIDTSVPFYNQDRKSTRLNSSHEIPSRMPSSA